MILENVKLISEPEASWINWYSNDTEEYRNKGYAVKELYTWYHHELKTPKTERVLWEEMNQMKSYTPKQIILEGKDAGPFSSREEFDKAIQMSHGDNWLYVRDGRRRPLSELQEVIDSVPMTISSEDPVSFMVRGYIPEPERGQVIGVQMPAVLYLAFPFRYDHDTELSKGIKIEPGLVKHREYEHDFGTTKVFLDLDDVNMVNSAVMNRRIAHSVYPIIRWYNESRPY